MYIFGYICTIFGFGDFMYNESIKLTSFDVPARFMRKNTIEPYGNAVPMHYHDEIEILRVVEGKLPCIINGVPLIVESGKIIFINSRIPHSTKPYCVKQDMIQMNVKKLLFSETAENFLSSLMLNRDISYHIFENSEQIKLSCLFDNTFEEYTNSDPGKTSFLLGILHTLCGILIRNDLISNPDDLLKNRKLEKILPAINYISENYSNEITTPQLAALCNLNTAYFCELFKIVTNKTPVEFLNLLRVRHAEKLINSTDKNIIEVANEVGFSSPTYFNRVFKKINGCSPTFYRKLKFSNI